jgi:hypothetical protein
MRKLQTDCKLQHSVFQCFGRRRVPKKTAKINQKVSKMDLRAASPVLPMVRGLVTPKNVKTVVAKGGLGDVCGF